MRISFGSTHRSFIRVAVVTAVMPVVLVAGCGSDDDPASTTTTAAETTTTAASTTTAKQQGGAGEGAFPTDEFCAAQADLDAAQDGAQRNTAIGEMQSNLGVDAPTEVTDALDTLLEGDLSPEQYTAAEQTLADACG